MPRPRTSLKPRPRRPLVRPPPRRLPTARGVAAPTARRGRQPRRAARGQPRSARPLPTRWRSLFPEASFRRSEESDVRRVTEQTAMSCCCTTHTAPAPSTRPVWDGADREGGSRPVLTVTPGASARPCPRAVHATPLRGGGQQRHRAPGARRPRAT